ncbi:tetratricopeptide repeat protein [Chthonobacter albigriseus]|uniref:tetratricopeptide repeat protein n=1 Tax=Chthonobacter albigriseus TaxID=1683161 RepID=UPI0015EE7635|nr:tetratricopeptide repeat protein [Chthonobacter albigriseus]
MSMVMEPARTGPDGGPRATVEDGRARHQRGDLSGAEEIYRALLAADPDDAEASHLLGVLMHQTGRVREAIPLIEAACRRMPERSAPFQNLVMPLIDAGRVAAAVEAGATAVRLAPRTAGPWTNYAFALVAAGRLEDAAVAAEQGLAVDVGSAALWNQLAHVRSLQGRHDIAESLLRRALSCEADNRDALYNLAVCLFELGRYKEAVEAYTHLLRVDPRHRGGILNLGVCLSQIGRVREALALWTGSGLDPAEFTELAYNLGTTRILSGDWSGWKGYERRLGMSNHRDPAVVAGKPLWTGEPRPGETLLVHYEQGLGDTVQFVRLVREAAERVGRVVVVVQPVLFNLLAQADPFRPEAGDKRITLLKGGDALPAFDCWIPLLSLPHRLGLEPEHLRPARPYLHADRLRVVRWADRLLRTERAAGILNRPFRVGLVWQGNPSSPAERRRSFPLSTYAALADLPGVVFYPLQKGFGAEQVADAPKGMRLLDLGPDFDTGSDAFLDTVAVARSLDLVITSDTSVAHVVGASGRPVWVVLKHVPDWRWGLSGETSPFYPSMRLFRQPEVGDFAGAVADVRAALAPLVTLRAKLLRAERETAPPPVEDAIARHAAGHYADAAVIYRRRLAFDADDPLANNLLAMAIFEGGARTPAAVAEALPLAWRAVGVAPENADGFANLGVLLKAAGRIAEAEGVLRQAIALSPAHPAALSNLVSLLIARGDADAAVRLTTALAEAYPRDPMIRRNQGVALRAAGRSGTAVAAFRIAAALAPADAAVRVLLGNVLDETGDVVAARAAWIEALLIQPEEPDALGNLGVQERRAGDPRLAAWLYRRALAVRPAHAEIWTNLGTALYETGLIEEAREAFGRAIALRPDYADAHMALGMTHLLDGDFEKGLEAYEWRLKSARVGMAGDNLPLWKGGDPAGRTLLLVTEQGFGDAIQFVRYAALLKAAGARVLVGCRARLARLMAMAKGVDGVVVEGETIPPVDGMIPVMSLPFLSRTRVETIPAAVPYIAVEPERVRRWAARLAEKDGFRIGLVWQGNPDPLVDRGRSVPLSALAPLAAIPGVRLIALQKGPGSEQVAALRGAFPVETLGPDFDEGSDAFLDTAAVMANLDLVVTTDTAALHLAGALGRPTFAILKANAEWRFLRGRSDSPWYPTLRLFRQSEAALTAPEPWADVVAKLAGEVAALAAGDRKRLLPVRTTSAVARPRRVDDPAKAFAHALDVHKAGRRDDARRLYGAILADHPDHAESIHMLGAIALQRQAYPEALVFLERARRAGLDSAEFSTNLAIAYRRTGRTDEAEAMLRAVLAAQPKSAETLVNLGSLLVETGRAAEALPLLEQAAVLRPWLAEVHRGMGNALKDLGRPAEALPHFDRAVRLAATDADLKVNRAHARLAVGDLAGGFADYEARWKSGELVPRDFTAPQWDGRAFEGRRLLIHGEQGLGDHIQFARFLPLVARRGGRVLLEVRRPLFGLLSSMDFGGAVEFVEQGGPVPDHDIQIAMMSLPFALGITLDSLPVQVPYLAAEPARVATWRTRLPAGDGPLVGLVWQGNPRARADKGRSPPLADLHPVLKDRRARFVVLQKEHGLDQLAGLPEGARVVSPGPGFDAGPDAFLDTAAVMTLCDLVITSDTAAAHLAGALARPTFLMLKFAPDWRWMEGRADSPWYPTMRLFRQRRAGDWRGVAEAVAAALAAVPGGR